MKSALTSWAAKDGRAEKFGLQPEISSKGELILECAETRESNQDQQDLISGMVTKPNPQFLPGIPPLKTEFELLLERNERDPLGNLGPYHFEFPCPVLMPRGVIASIASIV